MKAWRKVFETNTNGQIDHVIWGVKEAVLISGNGTRVQAFSYNNGFANWEYTLFNPKPAASRFKIFGIESKQESEVYFITNGYQACYINHKDKACIDLPE